MKRFTHILILLLLALHVQAALTWTTHFAYNNVGQVAAGNGLVYGVSSGALFSIDAQTEQIRTYSNQNGMHGTNIVCVQWLTPVQSLMIVYADGKIDILKDGTFRYVPDLYNKQTTMSKRCHSVTVHDSLAYLAMDYGVQTFHMRKREFIDTYFIGAEGEEVPVYSIALTSNAIYAAGDTVLYAASLSDNLVDYSYWSTLPLPKRGQIQGVATAGGELYLLQGNTCYRKVGYQWQAIDNQSYKVLNVIDNAIYPAQYPVASCDGIWLAAGERGMLRQMVTGEQIAYHLDGPLNNMPYRLNFDQDQLFMLPGGRWATQNNNPGCVMRYDGHTWHNITDQQIVSAVGGYCLDMMNAAVDPADPTHYFTTSYGTGLFEFRNDQCIKRWDPSNSIIGAAAPNNPAKYTRTDGAIYDAQNNLWVMVTGDVQYNIVIFTPQGEQIGMNTANADGSRHVIYTAGQLVFDNQHPNRVWALVPRSSEDRAAVALIDTKGTIANTDDDRSLYRDDWMDAEGNEHTTNAGYAIRQDPEGNLWFGTNTGVLIFPASSDYFDSNYCITLRVNDENGEPILADEPVRDIAFDDQGHAWLAGANTGVYVLSANRDTLLAHYTMDNFALPSNAILSLAYDATHKRMYIGSSIGLVAYGETTDDLNAEQSKQNEPVDYGSMMQWSTHLAYADIEDIKLSDSHVYALSEGSLCAIDKDDESVHYYSKQTGLTGSSIHRIAYDAQSRKLLIAYDDGMFDVLSADESIRSIPDLYLKQLNTLKQVENVAFHDGKAYLAMPFGILVLNMRKYEISDTYYIGVEGAELPVRTVAISNDSIYAASENVLYRAHLRSNLVDYAQWESEILPADIMSLVSLDDAMYMLMDSVIYRNGEALATAERFVTMVENNHHLLAYTRAGHIFEITASSVSELKNVEAYSPRCVIKDGGSYWMGTKDGVLHLIPDLSVQKYQPDGPSSNMPYSLTTFGSELWAVPGGRWTSGYLREGQVMYFNGKNWDNLTYEEICRRMRATLSLYDFGHVAVDPSDSKHFYVSSFGTGLVEFRPDGTAQRYNHDNSPLVSLVESNLRYRYCRVDAIAFDADRNLWLTNTGDLATNIHIIDPEGKWRSSFNLYSGTRRIVLNTVSKILMDSRYPNYKWIASAREQAGLILLDDNNTPYNHGDDRVVFRSTFVDQDKKSITLERLNTIAQDHNGDLWLGTKEGILVIDAATNMFQSNACRRLKISRHDGTNLADYLLGTEQINAIVFAGGNRIWIGTETSGVYLVHMITKEGIYEPEILAHFTTANSPMPSDCVLDVAINSDNGEVYIGTSKGLVSYRGDATDPEETYSGAYVYPNPVRPNYEGEITITGLMDNTTVYISDAAGNVVCRTHSNGGTAVWNGKTQTGKRAHSGVYTIYCNTADGKQHATLKVLLMY